MKQTDIFLVNLIAQAKNNPYYVRSYKRLARINWNKFSTRQEIYVKRNIEARLRNHGEAVSTAHSECMFVAL